MYMFHSSKYKGSVMRVTRSVLRPPALTPEVYLMSSENVCHVVCERVHSIQHDTEVKVLHAVSPSPSSMTPTPWSQGACIPIVEATNHGTLGNVAKLKAINIDHLANRHPEMITISAMSFSMISRILLREYDKCN
ncbi:hypothetical protein J6590_020282 [Homalodisca vitripennis]|nr:hypothetical protein J6590_020282 [Homalodisca vitripennis]